jgi:endonuclease III
MKLKASERQALLQKVVTTLKRKYGKKLPDANRSLLETLLFSACLEDASLDAAESAYKRLLASFHDLNEIRVSSISEIDTVLAPLTGAEWKALRIRDALQTVFEANYHFELEHLKRKTNEQAAKELNTLRYSSPYMKLSVLQALGGHVVPLDRASFDVLVWLGMVEGKLSIEAASEDLKSSVRKSEAVVLCHLLRELGSDPAYAGGLKLSPREREAGVDPNEAVTRLEALLSGRNKKSAGKSDSKAKVSKTKKKPAAAPAAKRPKKTASPAKVVKKKVTKKPAKPTRPRR